MMTFETFGGRLRFAAEPRQKSADRRGWAAAGFMVAGTLGIALASYSLSLQVSAERAATVTLAQQNAALQRELHALDAELRVRMRLPQLQRWNDEVLALKPITAQQYLANPVQLAAYGTQPVVTAPTLQLTLRTDVTARADAPAALRTIAATPAVPPADAAAVRQRSGQPAPVDPMLLVAIETMAQREAAKPAGAPELLRQIDMPVPAAGEN